MKDFIDTIKRMWFIFLMFGFVVALFIILKYS